MRAAVSGYVAAIHRAYLAQADTFPPGVRGALPLLTGGRLTVAAVGARHLHLLATTQSLGPLHGPEVAVAGADSGLAWEVRFFDPVVLPALDLVDESAGPAFEEVRHLLGIATVVYHFVAAPGAGLSAHQAQHVGTGLANSHSSAARDLETLRARARGREALIDEFAGAAAAGLPHAQALLARAIAPHDQQVAAAAEAAVPDPDTIRRALVASVGGRRQWTPTAAGPGATA
ncbi:MAG: hypothetical protein ACFCVG_10020 [Kineosporiaceae bacterium]